MFFEGRTSFLTKIILRNGDAAAALLQPMVGLCFMKTHKAHLFGQTLKIGKPIRYQAFGVPIENIRCPICRPMRFDRCA